MELGLAMGAMIVIFIVIFILALFYGALFLHLATKILSFDKTGFGRAFLTHICTLVLLSVITTVASIFTGPGGIVGFLLSALISIFVISGIYSEGFLKSLCAYIISLVLETIVTVLLIFGLAALAGFIAAMS
jgi:hypothetical protein